MSFSIEQKEFVISETYRSACCRRALLLGALFAKGTSDDMGNVLLSVINRKTADFLGGIINEIYGSLPSVGTSSVGGRRLIVSFKSKSAHKYISEIASHELFSSKCDSCSSSFLRGVFLTCGRICDPRKQYLLEFSMGDRCELLSSFLSRFGLKGAVSNKPNERILYFRSHQDIADFFALAGLNNAYFDFLNAKFEGELRQQAMRVANCETNNIDKATAAATKQLRVITALEKADLLSLLPDELESTARLRLEYFDLSLSQLAAVAVPPISKPGLSHRLKKIIELGEAILTKHNIKIRSE